MCLDPDLKGTSPGQEGLGVEVEAVVERCGDAGAVQTASGGVLSSKAFLEAVPGTHAVSFRTEQEDSPCKVSKFARGVWKAASAAGPRRKKNRDVRATSS